jgi:uncharacterized protein YfaP (DUF2135 family)
MRAWRVLGIAASLIAACTERTTPARDGGVDASAIERDVGAIEDAAMPDAGRDAPAPIDAADVDAAALACDGAMVTLPDPGAADGDATIPAGCTDCPSFSSVSVTTTGTTATITGTVSGATTCSWYLVSPSCGGTTGALGSDPEFGTFSRTLPLFCGSNRLQLVCDGPTGRAIATRTIDGPSCGSRDVQITLSWGATSNDQELHLVREGFHINDATNDCTWFTCVHASPDWGVPGDPTDDPHKDVDWTGTFGPENIYLMHAADGRYEVLVEYWGSGTTDSPSVTINLGGRTVWTGSHAMNLYDVWDVGTIAFPAMTFTAIDTITPCASAWRTGGSYGCALPIP